MNLILKSLSTWRLEADSENQQKKKNKPQATNQFTGTRRTMRQIIYGEEKQTFSAALQVLKKKKKYSDFHYSEMADVQSVLDFSAFFVIVAAKNVWVCCGFCQNLRFNFNRFLFYFAENYLSWWNCLSQWCLFVNETV